MSPRLSFLASLLLAACGLARADPDADFAEANRRFDSGDFGGAASAYEAIVRAGHHSPDLFYNLGAAKHRLGSSGEGALWMRRALVLEPGMPESVQSLAFLRARLAWFEFAENRLDRFIAGLSPEFGSWAVSLSLWTGCLALAAAAFFPRLKPNRSALVTLGLFLFLVALVASRVARHRAEHLAIENFATVTGTGTSAFTAPAPEAKAVVALPTGSEVRLLQRSGQWSYVEIPGDLRGWVRSEAIQPVWPIPSPVHES